MTEKELREFERDARKLSTDDLKMLMDILMIRKYSPELFETLCQIVHKPGVFSHK